MIAAAENWAKQMPASEWAIYKPVLEDAGQKKLQFALGGGLAFSYYSHMWRNTKDMDLFVLPQERHIAIDILNRLGFSDYHDRVSYDRSWIYRGFRSGVIVDIIWQMANHRAEVDARWMNGPQMHIDGMPLRVIPAEELLFAKLYVLQRERCDWPDLLNLLFVQGPELDWKHIRDRVDNDLPLLIGLLHVFAWLCPQRAAELPEQVTALIADAIKRSADAPRCEFQPQRAGFLDGRPWFVPLLKNQAPASKTIS